MKKLWMSIFLSVLMVTTMSGAAAAGTGARDARKKADKDGSVDAKSGATKVEMKDDAKGGGKADATPDAGADPKNASVFGTAAAQDGFKGDIYFIPEDSEALPDFKSLKPVGSVYTKKFDVPDQDFEHGFPGVTDRYEWFAIRYEGSFQVKKAGKHTFTLGADDGARLYIDGKLLVDNDGVHPFDTKSGTVTLTAGEHKLVLEYFQGPASELGLQLWVTAPGSKQKIFTK